MSLSFVSDKIPLQREADGVIRVGSTRVTLDTVIAAFKEGATAEEIVQRYPTLDLADVYRVIAYYLSHSTEIEDYLLERYKQSELIRKENEARFDPSGVRDRLLARRKTAEVQVMLALAADENFNNDILRGLRCRRPDLDIMRVQDVGLSGADDASILDWAADEGRVLLTHDVSCIDRSCIFAHSRGKANARRNRGETLHSNCLGD